MGKSRVSTIALFLLIAAAFILWYLVFVFPGGNFWIKLSSAAAFLGLASLFFKDNTDKGRLYGTSGPVSWRDVLLGCASAVVLYFVFWLGKLVLSVIFPTSETEIQSVYRQGEAVSPVVITALLLLVTSPAEELFWRGFVQKKLSDRTTPLWGLITGSILYAGVHIWTFNYTLILAALVAGLFWGYIYMRTGKLLPVIISHALWTTAIFVLFPMG